MLRNTDSYHDKKHNNSTPKVRSRHIRLLFVMQKLSEFARVMCEISQLTRVVFGDSAPMHLRILKRPTHAPFRTTTQHSIKTTNN